MIIIVIAVYYCVNWKCRTQRESRHNGRRFIRYRNQMSPTRVRAFMTSLSVLRSILMRYPFFFFLFFSNHFTARHASEILRFEIFPNVSLWWLCFMCVSWATSFRIWSDTIALLLKRTRHRNTPTSTHRKSVVFVLPRQYSGREWEARVDSKLDEYFVGLMTFGVLLRSYDDRFFFFFPLRIINFSTLSKTKKFVDFPLDLIPSVFTPCTELHRKKIVNFEPRPWVRTTIGYCSGNNIVSKPLRSGHTKRKKGFEILSTSHMLYDENRNLLMV